MGFVGSVSFHQNRYFIDLDRLRRASADALTKAGLIATSRAIIQHMLASHWDPDALDNDGS
jgi:hypothetical protein